MGSHGRSRATIPDASPEYLLLVEICFGEEMEENNIFLASSIGYFFVVLYAFLSHQVEPQYGIILILTAIMIIWLIRGERKKIRRKFEKRLRRLRLERER